jgi:hypothetical protein
LPRFQAGEIVHEACTLPVTIRTKAHTTSLAVWDAPSPVIETSPFRLKVGVKCSAGCPLAGQLVEVRDESGASVGGGRLSDSPWEGTTGLYWADVLLVAPARELVSSWSASFPQPDLELAHQTASASFTFRVTRRPDYRASIRVVGRDTQGPVPEAEVRLGQYVAKTDEHGAADFEVPAGSYELSIRADGFDAAPVTVDVNSDVTVQIDAASALTKAQWEEQLNEFKHIPWG